ncbi:uncharacterized protein LOC107273030 isoform X2 [Cephus cinctus]|uniref:Uncharacterized protein LOC107273030 isoform X2 n=1 Tax=Cephus cinctus TaxID=211228 RepID=A0AAJ7RSY5_CEPCN|nr:uncharacterized protein LOC107273030 isoform X2 [Cephus cinctus]XP_024946125.1 uncharacterized protein LOC107273030 isoform X2 [Cephus cinctus]
MTVRRRRTSGHGGLPRPLLCQCHRPHALQFSQFMDQDNDVNQSTGTKSLLSFLSLKRFKKRNGAPVALELAEDGGWPRVSKKYARLSSKNNASSSSGLDTPLQTLDARNLMKHQGCISSTPGSSLDLEWEHEGMPLPVTDDDRAESTDASLTQPSANNSQPSSLTASPWSRVSTPNSLEWDPVEADMVCVDVETEQLLTEIERLTDRALKETGEWTSTS